jgi:hypothetical protein
MSFRALLRLRDEFSAMEARRQRRRDLVVAVFVAIAAGCVAGMMQAVLLLSL